ncbi:MAG: hypothetical protein E7527_01865 [Ruminococcaceae bacterium]|nr:hypothetical protein [Oscillospiraceae bacterium]
MTILNKMGGIRLPALVALCAATVMLLSLLLPYAVTPGGYNPQPMPGYEGEVEDVSSYSMLSLTLKLQDQLSTNAEEMRGWIYVGLLGLCAVFCLCAMLFPLMDKATPTALFALLAYAPYYLYSLDITQIGFIGGREDLAGQIYYTWGWGYYLFHVALVVTVVAAVWLFVEKMAAKKKK